MGKHHHTTWQRGEKHHHGGGTAPPTQMTEQKATPQRDGKAAKNERMETHHQPFLLPPTVQRCTFPHSFGRCCHPAENPCGREEPHHPKRAGGKQHHPKGSRKRQNPQEENAAPHQSSTANKGTRREESNTTQKVERAPALFSTFKKMISNHFCCISNMTIFQFWCAQREKQRIMSERSGFKAKNKCGQISRVLEGDTPGEPKCKNTQQRHRDNLIGGDGTKRSGVVVLLERAWSHRSKRHDAHLHQPWISSCSEQGREIS